MHRYICTYIFIWGNTHHELMPTRRIDTYVILYIFVTWMTLPKTSTHWEYDKSLQQPSLNMICLSLQPLHYPIILLLTITNEPNNNHFMLE